MIAHSSLTAFGRRIQSSNNIRRLKSDPKRQCHQHHWCGQVKRVHPAFFARPSVGELRHNDGSQDARHGTESVAHGVELSRIIWSNVQICTCQSRLIGSQTHLQFKKISSEKNCQKEKESTAGMTTRYQFKSAHLRQNDEYEGSITIFQSTTNQQTRCSTKKCHKLSHLSHCSSLPSLFHL